MTKVYTFRKTFALALAGAMFCLLGSVSAQDWNYLGTPVISNDGASPLTSDIEVNSIGEPYVVYSDNIDGGITVKKFDGTAWNAVGAAGFSSGDYPNIEFNDNDVPFVAFLDGGVVKVMQFDGTNWVLTGDGGLFPSNSTDSAEPGLAFNNNMPYVVYPDSDQGSKATLKYFDGTSWVTLGAAGFSSNAVAAAYRLDFFADVPYVAFIDYTEDPTTYGFSVMTYQAGSWVDVGTQDFERTISPSSGLGFDIGPDGELYLAINNSLDQSEKDILTFNGSEWVSVGNPDFSGQSGGPHILEVFAGQVYFVYKEGPDNSEKFTVQRYNGNTWQIIGEPGFPEIPETNFIFNPSLAIFNEIVYVSFVQFDGLGTGVSVVGNDACEQNRLNLKLTVDDYPEETSWVIKNVAGETVASGGPYPNVPDQSTLEIPLCLDDDCYEFTIFDAWGDGICCGANGNGEYLLTNAAGDTLALGGVFTFSETAQICVARELPKALIASPEGTALNCYGGSLLLDGSNSFGENNLLYQWEDATQNIIGTDATVAVTVGGIYYLQVTDEVTLETDLDSLQIVTSDNLFLNLNFDDYPGDISWDLTGNNGFFMSGGPYTNEPASSSLTIPFCAESDCYNLNIYDSYGDGLCCDWGEGAYFVTSLAGDTLAMGAVFDTLETSFFCISNPPTALINPTQGTEVNCFNPEITLDGSGSNGENSLTYEWTDGMSVLGTDPTLTVDDSGVYYLIATDVVNLSTDTASVAITGGPPFLGTEIFPTVAHLDCDNPNSTLLVGIFNAQGAISYLWSNDSTSDQITVNTPGVYSVTVTDTANGCTASASVTISENTDPPTAVLNASSAVLDCFNSSVILDASGSSGQGTLTYEWTGGSTGEILEVTAPGTYEVTVTDSQNGCVASQAVVISDAVIGCTPFITTWETTASDESVTVPANGTGLGYNIDWGDGMVETGVTGPATHIYSTPGIHTVSITGELTNISFQATGDNDKLQTIEQWGNIEWTTFAWGFFGCSNLELNATDVPDLSNVTNTSRMFNNCTNFNSDINSWDVSNVTNMASMFQFATTFNQPLDNWDVSGVTIMFGMFADTEAFDQPLNSWDVSGVTNMSAMFLASSSFNQPLDMWTVSNVTNMNNMFANANSFNQDLGGWDISSVTTMSNMLSNSGLSIQNYDNTLIGWESGTVSPNVTLGAAGLKYCGGEAARTSLIDVQGWTFVGDSKACMALTCPSSVTEDACQTQAAIDAAFVSWLESVMVENGCNPILTNDATSAPDAEMGGSVTVTFTATDECSGSPLQCMATFTVEAPTVTAMIDAPTTQLDCDTGSIILNASGSTGQGTLGFEWTGGSTGSTLEVTAAGEYFVTVTDAANGCTSVDNILITQNTDAPWIQAGASPSTELNCIYDFSILWSTGAGTTGEGVTLVWSNGHVGSGPTVTEPGTYSVTITDLGNGCTNETSVTITENITPPTPDISVPATILDCNNPSLLLDASGSSGQSTLTYVWTGGSTGSTLEVTSGGNYDVTITDSANGCTAETSISITENFLLPIAEIDAPTTQLDCNNETITLDASDSSGQGALSFQWNTGGEAPTPDAHYTFENNTNDSAGANNGTAQNGPTYATGQLGQAIDLDGVDQHVTLPSGMFDTYNDFTFAAWVNWDGPGSSVWERIFDFGNNTTQYMLLTPNGWPNNFRFAIKTSGPGGEQRLEAAALPVNEWTHVAVVLDGDTGTLYVNGSVVDSGTITVNPSDIAPMLNYFGRSQFPADPYFDGQIDDVQIFNTALSTAEISEVMMGGGTTDMLIVSTPGTYSVTVTDAANGCSDETSITITENNIEPTAMIDAPTTQLDCESGSITLDASGSTGQGTLSYEWTGGSMGSTLEVTAPGEYFVTVTDAANGCSAVSNILITQDIEAPVVMVDANPGTVLTCDVTSILLEASYSGPSFAFVEWSNGSVTDIISVNEPGVYSYSVTDLDNGCITTVDVTITENTVEPTATITAPATELNCDLPSITLDASSSTGQGTLTYEWLGGNTGPTLEATLAGTYMVTVTDAANGCTAEASFTITDNFLAPSAAIDAPTTQLDCSTGNILLNASGSTGQGTLSYAWTGGSTGSTLSVSAAGDYSVTVTDGENGCADVATITITQDEDVPTAVIDAPTTQLDCNVSSIVLDASGSTGQGTLTYEWTGGSTGATLEVTSEGDYSVTITDSANGCTSVAEVTITISLNTPDVSISAPETQLDCNTSSIVLSGLGFVVQPENLAEWLWSNGSTEPSITVTSPGTYSVTLTDGYNGCSSEASIIITENYIAPTANIDAPTIQLDCDTGSIMLDASGSAGQGTLTYEWTGGSTGATLEVTSEGDYSVTITDSANGCTSVAEVTITISLNTPDVSISAPETQLDCNTSSIVLSGLGFVVQPENLAEWLWSNGSTEPSITVTSPGTYSVTLTDGYNGCSSEASITITENLIAPTANIDAPATELNCDINSIELDASGSFGQGELSYQWTGGSTDSTLVVTTAGDYSVTVTDAVNGCTAVETITITQDENIPTATISAPETQLDCDTDSIILDASGSTGQGTLTYEWTGGSTGSTLEVNASGNYGVTITDSANGCTAESSITITENYMEPAADISAAMTQLDCSIGSIILDASGSTGQGVLSYEWTGGGTGPTLEVTVAGDYSVTVTDGENGCTNVATITITQDDNIPTAAIDALETQLDCDTDSIILDASVSTGVNALAYEWTGGSTSPTLEVTMPGVYSVTVTDTENNCTSATSVTVTENYIDPVAIINSEETQLDCDTGSIILDASGSFSLGPLSYEWTGGSTGSTLEVTVGGEYFVTVTDPANGCSSASSIIITEDYAAPTANIDAPTTQLDCNNTSIVLDASGSSGQAALTYEWTGGSTVSTLEVTSIGDYSVTVTDSANGCTAVETITITDNFIEPTATIEAPVTEVNCANSSITLDASGSVGQGTLTYEWPGGGTAATLDVTSQGDYSVTVTDAANGCSSVATITITQNFTPPMATINAPITEFTCDITSLTLDASGSSGQGDVSFEWTGGSTEPIIEVTSAGVYFVTVTDAANGCTAIESVTITQDEDVPTAVITSATTQLDCTTGNILLVGTTSTGQGTLSYEWSDGSTGFGLTVTAGGDYGLTVTDSANGCIAETSITIIENYTEPTAIIDAPVTQLDCNTGSIVLDASGSIGQGTLSYEWTDGSTGSSLEVTVAGNYSVTITDSENGCSSANTITITQDDNIPIAVIDQPVTQLDCNVPSITLDASGSTGVNALTYEWTGGSTGPMLEVTTGGTYTVTVTDTENSCMAETSVVIIENYIEPISDLVASTTQLDCDVSSILLDASASSGLGPLSYEWTGGSTGSTLEVTVGGEYFVTVTDPANGCSSTSSIIITENYTPPTANIDAATTQLDCNVPAITLDASVSMGQSALSYTWTGGSTSSEIIVSMAGDYFVTITDSANGCQSVTSISITMDVLAPTAVITPPAITLLDCNNPAITLDAGTSSGQGTLSYAWTGGGTNSTLEVTSAGDYSVTVTDSQNGCTDVDVITITEDFAAPSIVIETPQGTQLDCDTEMLTIDAGNSTGQAALSFVWTGGSTNPALEVTEPGDYSVTVTDSQNGCTSVQTITITQDQGNVMVSYNDPVCVGDELQLFNTNAAIQWQWEGPDDFTSADQNPTITDVTSDAGGTYSVTITESSGCTYVGSIDVTINALPGINISGDDQVCEAGNIILTENAGDAVSWSWAGPESFTSDDQDVNIPAVSDLEAGLYQLTVTDNNGCMSTAEIDISVLELPAVEITSSSPVCTDEDLQLLEVGGESVLWSWTGPGGFTASTSDVFISSDQVQAGTYTVTGTGDNGCPATAQTEVVTVQGQLIESNFLVGSMACVGDSLRFIDYTNIDIDTTATFFWDFGNGDTSTERDPVYIYNTPGLYDIQLEVLSGSCPNFSIVKSVGIVDCLNQPLGLIDASLRPTINDGQFDVYVELLEKGDILLEIFDVNGKKIQSEFFRDIEQLQKSITIEEVGLYFVQIGHQNGVETLRAIVIE